MAKKIKTPEQLASERVVRAAYMKDYAEKNKEKKAAYDKEYRENPQNKADRLAYRSQPEIKARDAENRKKRLATPEGRAKLDAYVTSPETRARRRHIARVLRINKPGEARARSRRSKTRIQKKFNLLKIGRPCYDCGGMFPPEAMDWDHLPGASKSFTVARGILNRSAEEALAEIDKCQLVCACCHRVRTMHRCRKEVA